MRRNRFLSAVILFFGLLLAECKNDITLDAPSKPDAPKGLAVEIVSDNSIAVSWIPVNGAKKYHLYIGAAKTDMTQRGTSTTAAYTLTELSADTTYYIAVSTENSAGEGAKCAVITATTNKINNLPAPAGLTAETITETSITVQWNSVSGATGYRVYARTTTAGVLELKGSPTVTTYTITGLSDNTTYYIAVSAVDSTGESNRSAAITKLTKPAVPSGLTTGGITSNSITLLWTNSNNGVITYTVYAGTTETNMTQRGTSTTAAYTISGLSAGTRYYIAVSAKNASGESERSISLTTTTKLFAPTGVTATALNTTTIQISWNAAVGAESYKIYRAADAAGTYLSIGTVPATSTSYNDTGRSIKTQYYYKVSSFFSDNVESDLSDYTSASIPAQTNDITQFRFTHPSATGTINGTNITVTVPTIVNLTALAPEIIHNGYSVNPASGIAQDFSSPVQYTVTAENGITKNYMITVTVADTSLVTAFNWLNNYAQREGNYIIVPKQNESLGPTIIDPNFSSIQVTLRGGDTEKTISLSSNGSLFTVKYGTLILDEKITLQGRSSNTASLVTLSSSSAKLIMNTGSKITGNTLTRNDEAFGGGVRISYGTFTMNGGTISDNKVEATSTSSSYSNSTSYGARGGGVYVYSGTFEMNGGTISGNTAYSAKYPAAGGGVFVDNSFVMTGGTISGNISQSSSVLATSYTYGGGVATYGTFTMQGGTISGNTVSSADYRYGGGVYAKNDKFIKTGGNIYGSNASPTSLQNTAKDTNSGHAAYATVGSSTILKRNTTAGTTVNLDSSRTGSSGGWE
jgi:hypothetical protein